MGFSFGANVGLKIAKHMMFGFYVNTWGQQTELVSGATTSILARTVIPAGVELKYFNSGFYLGARGGMAFQSISTDDVPQENVPSPITVGGQLGYDYILRSGLAFGGMGVFHYVLDETTPFYFMNFYATVRYYW